MKLTHRFGGMEFEFDLARPIDLSIPLRFGGPQPNAFGVEPASAKACEYGELVGDTRRGGSCNFEQVTLIPHCNGTHTECIGHITDERVSVRDVLREALFPAVLVSVLPVAMSDSGETYDYGSQGADPVITSEAIRSSLAETGAAAGEISSIIVRTLPNTDDKLSRLYKDEIPPYFTAEALSLIDELGFEHLICDLPSIDRLHDGGRLSNHRIFWNIEPGSRSPAPDSRTDRTITELTYAPDDATDGIYILDLQIAPFHADAAPSRPVLFPIRTIQ